MTLAIIALVAGIGLHIYSENTQSKNQKLSSQYQTALTKHKINNIYYEPDKTIAWLARRQNTNGYFVINPDLINEPSQLNANSLRATRYALSTLAELNGLNTINKSTARDFILSHYQETHDENGNKVAGFATESGDTLGIRPTMDAVLSLKSLSALDSESIDLTAIKNFIISHQNKDGGFWDLHYPEYGRNSCLKCTSFAMRALGTIYEHTNKQFSEEFINKVISYISSAWDPETQSYSAQSGKKANDSYNIFRAFISLWYLKNGTNTDKAHFVSNHLNLTALSNTIKQKFQTTTNVYSRKINSNHPSMKATHLLVWMFIKLDMHNQLDKNSIIQYVQFNQSSPGEYGGDIYNTYSATSIFNKLNVAIEPLPKPKEPEYNKLWFPDFLPYLFYLLSSLLLLFYSFNNKKQLENKTSLLETKIHKDKLTGIFNREYLENAYQYHTAYNEQLSLILLDVDHFKRVNDNYGHLTGDYVLQKLAKLVSENIRKTDVLARWGGEEFAILCPSTTSGPAKILAEKLRALIYNYTFDTISNISCSFGISSSQSDDTFESLFKRADKALYQSKKNGRNQVNYLA